MTSKIVCDEDRREPERRLVEHQQPRARHQAPGRSRASAARRPKASRPSVRCAPRGAERSRATRSKSAATLGRVVARERAQLEVLAHGHAREDAPAFGRVADAARARSGRASCARSRCRRSGSCRCRTDQPADRAQRRRLARAVGADQRDDLALLDAQANAGERADAPVASVEVFDLKQRHVRRPRRCRDRLRSRAGRGEPRPACPSAIFSPWSSTVMRSLIVHHQPHVVFDQENRHAALANAADQLDQIVLLAAGSSRRPARRAAAVSDRSRARARSRAGAGSRTAGCAHTCRRRCSSRRSAAARARARARRALPPLRRRVQQRVEQGSRACARARPVITLSSADMNANRRMF